MDNPYCAPSVERVEKRSGDGYSGFEDYNFKELRKLYYRSCNVVGLAIFWCIGTTALVAVGVQAFVVIGIDDDPGFYFFIAGIIGLSTLLLNFKKYYVMVI